MRRKKESRKEEEEGTANIPKNGVGLAMKKLSKEGPSEANDNGRKRSSSKKVGEVSEKWAVNVGGNSNSNGDLEWAELSPGAVGDAGAFATAAHRVDSMGKAVLLAAILLFNICFWTVALRNYATESNLGRLEEKQQDEG